MNEVRLLDLGFAEHVAKALDVFAATCANLGSTKQAEEARNTAALIRRAPVLDLDKVTL